MIKDNHLERFLNAQKADYAIAFSEIKNGRKRSHWMWYIFPQIQGLGFTETSKYYAIKNIGEAEAFLNHSILGDRLVAISKELLNVKESDANKIFGSPDDIKLKSSMTLFSALSKTDPVFQLVLDKFFNGEKDMATLQIISEN
ncbi:MAG: DUF1810 domain-containing protein [Sphingobacteriales bacterium]